MTEAKLEIKVGNVSFSGEGQGEWLSKQLDKVLAKLSELADAGTVEPDDSNGGAVSNAGGTHSPSAKKTTLAAFLKDKNAASNQSRKFLATAAWLHDNENKTRLTTADVTRALTNSNQTRLANASKELGRNNAKGFIEKDGKSQFYVTDDGRVELNK